MDTNVFEKSFDVIAEEIAKRYNGICGIHPGRRHATRISELPEGLSSIIATCFFASTRKEELRDVKVSVILSGRFNLAFKPSFDKWHASLGLVARYAIAQDDSVAEPQLAELMNVIARPTGFVRPGFFDLRMYQRPEFGGSSTTLKTPLSFSSIHDTPNPISGQLTAYTANTSGVRRR